MKHARLVLVLALLLVLVAVQIWLVSRALSNTGARAREALVVSTVALSEPIVSWGRLGGVASDPVGFVYMANFAENVWKIAPDGTVVVWGSGLNGASGNSVNSQGELLQASFYDNTVRRIDRDGAMTTFAAEGLAGPVGVFASPGGDVFVNNCSANSVVRIRPSQGVPTVEVVATGELFDCPSGITGDDEGNLYVVNFNTDTMVRIAADGSLAAFAEVAPETGWPKRHVEAGIRGSAHLVFARDRFYVTKVKANSIWEVDLEGKARLFAGTFRQEHVDGPLRSAGLASPNGIALSGTTLFFNTIEGTWRQTEATTLALRRIHLPSS